MSQQNLVLPPGQSRREFVKVFAQIGAYVSLCAPVGRFFVGEVRAQTADLTGIFNVSLADPAFVPLQTLNGSVRVEVPNGAGIVELIALNNATPSIILTRVATTGASQFGAVNQRCTHQGFAVNTRNATTGTLICSSGHGGSYNPATGAVVTQPVGGTATTLTPYQTVFNPTPAPGTLQITLPGIGYTMVGNAVTSTNGPRVRLQFPTRSGSNYEVRFQSSVTGTNTVLPFFTTQNGIVATNRIAGSNIVQSVFVTPPPQVGFYVIAAKE